MLICIGWKIVGRGTDQTLFGFSLHLVGNDLFFFSAIDRSAALSLRRRGKTLYKMAIFFFNFLGETFRKNPHRPDQPTQSFGATTGVATPKAKARCLMFSCAMCATSIYILRTPWKILLFRSFQTFQVT
jgi:hypothetical protein